jgi:asparagine synthase (glutamine-hydrolysing)
MCGICGVIGGPEERAEARVREMLRKLVHRGPDDEGLLVKRGAALGMRRLSIIDLPGGHQPVYNETGEIGVVFNGEVYNFPRLRSTLEAHGHKFRTRSDTEVIVHAYEEWGDACVERLQGMFAFAVWDGRGGSGRDASLAGRILLARDRLGIKPLYYAVAQGALFFASEVRALLASGAVARDLAPQSIEAYLLFGSVAESMTLLRDIFSLPPGHRLALQIDAPLDPKPAPYWDISGAAHQHDPGTPEDVPSAAAATRPLLENAVRSHLLADVPVGVFLSSGLDSTALAALAARESSRLHTLTVAFAEQEFNEAPLARETAKRLGTDHREVLVTSEEMHSRLFEAIGALDQPSMDGINTFFVSWAARQAGLKVALSGLGADEVFGGYPSFRLTPRVAKLATIARWLPAPARQAISKALAEIARRGAAPQRSDSLRKLAAIFRRADALPHPYFFTRMLFTPRQIESLLSPGALAACREADFGRAPYWRAWLEQTVEQASAFTGDSAVSCLELRHYMLNTLLRDTDSMSMHHSLEVRVPFLDHPLVEFVASLPDSAKRQPNFPKALLAESVSDLLPQEILEQSKRTFTFPWERWLRGQLGLEVAVRLGRLTPSLAAVMDCKSVESIWRSFLLRRTGWARPWSLFVLNEWVRRHVDEAETSSETERVIAGALAN